MIGSPEHARRGKSKFSEDVAQLQLGVPSIISLTGELLDVRDVSYREAGTLSAACDLDCVIVKTPDLPADFKEQYICYSLDSARGIRLPTKLPHELCKTPAVTNI